MIAKKPFFPEYPQSSQPRAATFPQAGYLNCRRELLSLQHPRIAGILNLTPDSFSDGGQHNRPDAALRHTEAMLQAGADFIDVGGVSTRPYAPEVDEATELQRVMGILPLLIEHFPRARFSIDTFRAKVAEEALAAGAVMVNDISGGVFDPEIFSVAARHKAPYVLMHMQGTPQTMQDDPQYEDVAQQVYSFFVQQLNRAKAAGLADILLDPGFGFGKTVAHNYALFRALPDFHALGCPLYIGISRKSMLSKGLDISREATEAPALALHLQALLQGVAFLRVHQVAAAALARKLYFHLSADGTL